MFSAKIFRCLSFVPSEGSNFNLLRRNAVFVQQIQQNVFSSLSKKDPQLIKSTSSSSNDRTVKISKAMKVYLERAQQHDKFMEEQTMEYEMGKRHLCNMMGADPNTFSQSDIDEAIRYLMPSGLFDSKARPMMKHPKDIFPVRKAAEFDQTGRPFNSFFYTNHPVYYNLLYNIVDKFNELDEFEDKMIKKGISRPSEETLLDLSGSEWLDYKSFQKVIVEEIQEYRYNYFILSIKRLTQHPYAFRCKDFIMKYRKPLVLSSKSIEIPPLTIDENERTFVKADGSRKLTKAEVIVYSNGNGQIKINGKGIDFFPLIQNREQLLFPLQFTGLLNKVDVVAEVTTNGGTSCQAGAVRQGISFALRSFVNPDMLEKMRLAGLLTKDPRKRERKKPGQEGARRKFTWHKR